MALVDHSGLGYHYINVSNNSRVIEMTKKIALLLVALTLFGAGWDQCYSANEAIERIRMMRSKARTESYLDEGRQDVEKGAYLKAVRVLTEALNRGAGGDEAYELRARAYMGLGNMDSALKDLDRLVSTKPSDSKGYVMRADAENVMEYYDKAISDYNRAIELDPFLQDAYLGRSVSYAAFEKYDLAIRDLELALKIDQRNPEALYNLAMICLVADMPKAGREYINRALAADVNAEDRDRLASILAAIPEKSDFEDRKGGIQGVLASLGKQESLTTASRSGHRSRPDLDVPTTDQKKLPYSKKSSQEQDAAPIVGENWQAGFLGFKFRRLHGDALER